MSIQPNSFTSVGQTLTIPSRFLRDKPELVSRDKSKVTYTCNTCGTVEPHSALLRASQNEVTSKSEVSQEPEKVWVRRPCKCELYAWDAAALTGLKREASKAKVSATYRWLGMEDEELEEKSFSNFDPSVQGQKKAAFQQALETAKEYALAVAQNQRAGNLYMYG